jgi:hypothetical protein
MFLFSLLVVWLHNLVFNKHFCSQRKSNDYTHIYYEAPEKRKQISHLAIEPVENRSLPITGQICKIVVLGIQKDEKAIDIHLSWLMSLNNCW